MTSPAQLSSGHALPPASASGVASSPHREPPSVEVFARRVIEDARAGYPLTWSGARFVGTWDGLAAECARYGYLLGLNGDRLVVRLSLAPGTIIPVSTANTWSPTEAGEIVALLAIRDLGLYTASSGSVDDLFPSPRYLVVMPLCHREHQATGDDGEIVVRYCGEVTPCECSAIHISEASVDYTDQCIAYRDPTQAPDDHRLLASVDLRIFLDANGQILGVTELDGDRQPDPHEMFVHEAAMVYGTERGEFWARLVGSVERRVA